MLTNDSTTKHTPGPWSVQEENHRMWIAPVQWRNSRVVQDWREHRSGAPRGGAVTWRGFSDEARANARLIALAPEMVEALRNLLVLHCDRGDLCTSKPHVDARALLARLDPDAAVIPHMGTRISRAEADRISKDGP